MKTLLRFISLLLSLLIAVIVLLNITNTITLENSFLSLRANVGFLILFCTILGSLVTIFLSISSRGALKWYHLWKLIQHFLSLRRSARPEAIWQPCLRLLGCKIATPFVLLRARNDKTDWCCSSLTLPRSDSHRARRVAMTCLVGFHVWYKYPLLR